MLQVLSFCEVIDLHLFMITPESFIVVIVFEFSLSPWKLEMSYRLAILQTKVTPIVEGYGGWAFRMEIVPIESAYPGFGELVVSVIF